MGAEEEPRPHRFRRAVAAVRDGAARVDPETALLLLAAIASVTLIPIEASLGVALYDVPVFVAFLFALAHAGCIPLAVRHPALATILALASVAALQMMSAAPTDEPWPWPWWPVLIVMQSLIGAVIALRGSSRAAIAFWISSLVVSSLVSLSRAGESEASSLSIVIFASVCGGVQVIASVFAQWSDIREQLITERRVSNEEYSLRVVAEDRARIARELHDVVAHSLSVITVQASTASFRHDDISPAAAGEFDEIAAASRQAMREMRDLLGVLRAGPEVEQAPQPMLDDVPELVEQSRRAGADVDIDEWLSAGELREVSPVAGLVIYRIVQQALGNALRHSPGSRILISARVQGMALWVSIENDAPAGDGGSADADSASGSGMGLVNMAERAAGVGGSVRAGATPDGGYRVDATVPLRASALADIDRT